MKLLASSVLAFSIMSCSLLDNDIPASKVPSVVKNAFEQQYNNPVDVEWEKKKRNYEVDFELENVDHAALFNPEGRLLMAKQDISETDLPTAITDRIAVDFPDHYIDDVDKVETGEKTLYQVELDGSVRDWKVVYTADGQETKDVKYWD